MTDLILPSWLVTFVHVCVLAVFILGLLCFFLRKRYIRQLVGLKLMLQSISLGLILTGWQKGDPTLAQSMVISALVIEAVVIGLALTMIIHIARHAQDEKDFVE
ncbi:MAG: NADH-quinone oxidoreductase subunit K [Brevefilum sp.]